MPLTQAIEASANPMATRDGANPAKDHLSTLPCELFERVAESVNCQDVLSLRLISRKIRSMSARTFGKEWLSKNKTVLCYSVESIEVVLRILQDENCRNAIESGELRIDPRGRLWNAGLNSESLSNSIKDPQLFAIRSAKATRLLHELVKLLSIAKNLKSLTIVNESYLVHDSIVSNEGGVKLTDCLTNSDLDPVDIDLCDHKRFANDKGTAAATACHGQTHLVDSVYIIAQFDDSLEYFESNSLPLLDLSNKDSLTLRQGLSNLRSLSLRIDAMAQGQASSPTFQLQDGAKEFFMTIAPRLEVLILNGRPSWGSWGEFVREHCWPALMQLGEVLATIKFQRLTTMELRYLLFKNEALTSFLSQHTATVENLKLDRVAVACFQPCTRRRFLRELENISPPLNTFRFAPGYVQKARFDFVMGEPKTAEWERKKVLTVEMWSRRTTKRVF